MGVPSACEALVTAALKSCPRGEVGKNSIMSSLSQCVAFMKARLQPWLGVTEDAIDGCSVRIPFGPKKVKRYSSNQLQRGNCFPSYLLAVTAVKQSRFTL